MVGEADADVVVVEVLPRRSVLVSRLAAPETVLVVENVLKLQSDTGFVLQDFPCDVGIP